MAAVAPRQRVCLTVRHVAWWLDGVGLTAWGSTRALLRQRLPPQKLTRRRAYMGPGGYVRGRRRHWRRDITESWAPCKRWARFDFHLCKMGQL